MLLLDDGQAKSEIGLGACGKSLNALIYWQQDAPAPGSSVSPPFENVNVLAKFQAGSQASASSRFFLHLHRKAFLN